MAQLAMEKSVFNFDSSSSSLSMNVDMPQKESFEISNSVSIDTSKMTQDFVFNHYAMNNPTLNSSDMTSFCITNPLLLDNPIVYVSDGFLRLTGYSRIQVLGRNCRFLQGPKTDQRQLNELRKGINAGTDTSVCIVNYKADGSIFYNQIFMSALRNNQNAIVNFVGIQIEVDKRENYPTFKVFPLEKVCCTRLKASC